jgi:hypothetical protein
MRHLQTLYESVAPLASDDQERDLLRQLFTATDERIELETRLVPRDELVSVFTVLMGDAFYAAIEETAGHPEMREELGEAVASRLRDTLLALLTEVLQILNRRYHLGLDLPPHTADTDQVRH